MSGPAVHVEKHFRHPRERVFDAFLDPARVGRWLFHTPEGVMEQTDYDPVVGGSFAIFERRGADPGHGYGATDADARRSSWGESAEIGLLRRRVAGLEHIADARALRIVDGPDAPATPRTTSAAAIGSV